MSHSQCPHSSIISTLIQEYVPLWLPSSAIWPPSQVLSEGDQSFFVHSSLSHVRPNIWLTSLLLSKIFSQIENIFGIFHVINFVLSTHPCLVSIQTHYLFIFFKIFSLLVLSTGLICLDYHLHQVFTFESSGPRNFLLSRNLQSLVMPENVTQIFPHITFIGRYHMRNLILVSG